MSGARRVAAIDVGTNTVLLLVATGTTHAPEAVLERSSITRLGQGVDRTQRLLPEAIDRTLAALESYAVTLREQDVDAIDVVCTSAARDAANGAEFIERASRVLGVTPRIIAGDEEARLTFAGALSGLAVRGDVTVFDIGGGSTEIIGGTAHESEGEVATAISLDVGSVRLTERHVRSDPPLSAELVLVEQDISRALGTVAARAGSTLVGVAGTITTLAAIDQGLEVYDSSRVHGSRLARGTIVDLTKRLGALALPDRRAVTGLEPARADVIVAGALIALGVLAWAGVDDLVVSDRGVRWGLARALLAR